VRIATWNLEWSIPGTGRDDRIRGVLEHLEVEVLVLTEASTETVPPDGYVVSAHGDWGYNPKIDSHRKVFMWSRQPWTQVDTVGSDEMPAGRFVAATTQTSIGSIEVIGVCIPWKDAHVRTGAKNKKPWEDHLAFLSGLQGHLSTRTGPLILAGDFNQRIPSRGAPPIVAQSLNDALGGLVVATETRGQHALIDHVAHTRDLDCKIIQLLANADSLGRLSDHTGVVVDAFGAMN
jgi:endonuclease/exonuclease/phosphatase family metal-dependent hydrolase